MGSRIVIGIAAAFALLGCAKAPQDSAPAAVDPAQIAAEDLIWPAERTPPMSWAERPEAAEWTMATKTALATHGRALLFTVPADIDLWCPAYPDLSYAERGLFWTGILSRLTKHESTYRPDAVGGGGQWYGLTQILPQTARYRNCKVGSGAALKDGAANLSCAVRIAAITVPRDGVVSEGFRGLAADWGPFHSESKRSDMRNWMLAQPYCQTPSAEPAAQSTRRSFIARMLGR